MPKTAIELSYALKKEAEKKGFSPVGIAIIPGSKRIKMRTASLQRWIARGNHADMEWMKSPGRIEIEKLLDGVQSVLIVGLNYFTQPKINNPNPKFIKQY